MALSLVLLVFVCQAFGGDDPKTKAESSTNPISASYNFPAASSRATASLATLAKQLYSHGEPTAEEQLMLELINRARANPSAEAANFGIDLNEGLNPGQISATPKQPLAMNRQITQAARDHSKWMLDTDIFEHIESNGSNPGDRMWAAGYVLSGSWTWGENIAWRGTTGSGLLIGPTVTLEHRGLFVDQGIAGRGHRINLMNGAFREIGVGVALGVFTSSGKGYQAVMITQDFGASGANPGPFVLGVVYRDADRDGLYGVGEGVAGITVMPASGSYYAITSASGGYDIPLASRNGSLQITFSGAPLPGPVAKTVELTSFPADLDA